MYSVSVYSVSVYSVSVYSVSVYSLPYNLCYRKVFPLPLVSVCVCCLVISAQ